MSESTTTTTTTNASATAELYPAVPQEWLWLPKPARWVLGWAYLMFFSLSFFSPLFATLLLLPVFWRRFPLLAGSFAVSLVISMVLPAREWKWFRRLGQLWYELFDFSTNVSPQDCVTRLDYADKQQVILAMHPHGIVPFQALLWAAYADQYLGDSKREMYGFGAAADIVMYMPFLRNIMGYLAGGSASYHVLKRGLVEGKVKEVPNRIPRNLYILPGGIAEIFTSTPGRNAIVFKGRRGLCKLSVETGAQLVPCYVFGGTDFFHNLATSENVITKISRKLRVGVTIFWGRLGLPIPFSPKVTMVLGDPIPIPVIDGDDENKSKAIEALHATFLQSMTDLFNKYKGPAGYPNSELEIL